MVVVVLPGVPGIEIEERTPGCWNLRRRPTYIIRSAPDRRNWVNLADDSLKLLVSVGNMIHLESGRIKGFGTNTKGKRGAHHALLRPTVPIALIFKFDLVEIAEVTAPCSIQSFD